MTTKILTVRIPSPLYAAICQQAAETGVPVSAYVRRMVEQEHQAQQVTELRNELLSKLDSLANSVYDASSGILSCRYICTFVIPVRERHNTCSYDSKNYREHKCRYH